MLERNFLLLALVVLIGVPVFVLGRHAIKSAILRRRCERLPVSNKDYYLK